MNIEKRLRQDAQRISQMQPPKDLRARLQASLDSVPMETKPIQRPVRRWFTPAIALLSAAMLLVFVTMTPMISDMIPGNSVLRTGDVLADHVVQEMESGDDRSLSEQPTTSNPTLPWGRVGIFVGLALLTGTLCVVELKGRPRILLPSLATLAIFAAICIAYMLNLFAL